jgi:hypothetical protein
MRLWLRYLCFGIASIALASATGCRLSNPDIDTWKGTVRGPAKMVAVLLADKYPLELRAYAALALVDMERQDVDGVAELLNAIQKLDGSTRDKLIQALVLGLLPMMQGAADKPSASGEGPPPRQIRAKDAAFALITHAAPDSRKALTDAVMRWYTADFNGRSLSGNYSAEQVVRALGSDAAKTLVDALGARLPQQALVKLAQLIGQLGDPAAKERAAQKLVQIEAEMRSDAFLGWLRDEITSQLGKDGKPDPVRVDKAARMNRERFIDEGTIPAMKYLADQQVVTDRLLAIAAEPDAALAERRTRALQALEGKVGPAQLEPLLALALDTKAPSSVQDYAFDRVGDIRSPLALPRMWPLVQDGTKQRLRWRAGELVLTIGGSAVLGEFLSKLPSNEGVAYEPEELEGYAARIGQMTPFPVAVVAAQLASPNWWNRVIALDLYERKGTEADVPAISRLLGDTASVKGKNWEAGSTVGKVAKHALDGLRERTGQTQG